MMVLPLSLAPFSVCGLLLGAWVPPLVLDE